MFFDSHIHFDQLSEDNQKQIITDPHILGVIAVSMNLESSKTLLALSQHSPKVRVVAGFHPEQMLPSLKEQDELFDWLAKHQQNLTAIGEVGLPHYLKRENPQLDYSPYWALLERFIVFAKRSNLPLNLHIVHDDVRSTLKLLEKHNIEKAHFHWLKTDDNSLAEFLASPYLASLTPDIIWNVKTQKVAKILPLERLMIETDSPWQHESFENTNVATQLHAVVQKLAVLKGISPEKVKTQVLENTLRFYQLNMSGED